jgi:hypothetical protein
MTEIKKDNDDIILAAVDTGFYEALTTYHPLCMALTSRGRLLFIPQFYR